MRSPRSERRRSFSARYSLKQKIVRKKKSEVCQTLLGRCWQSWHFKNYRIYKELYGKPLKCDSVARVVFLIQVLLIFGGRCNRYGWKFTGYLILICYFSLCQRFSKAICFPVCRKLISWSIDAEGLFLLVEKKKAKEKRSAVKKNTLLENLLVLWLKVVFKELPCGTKFLRFFQW